MHAASGECSAGEPFYGPRENTNYLAKRHFWHFMLVLASHPSVGKLSSGRDRMLTDRARLRVGVG
jgi:hypothetical protein